MASVGPEDRGRPSGAEWTAWLADAVLYANSNRPRNGQASPHVASDRLRVSDGERTEVAELLSRHYSDGRLDHDELNERLQAAMSAKTRADLKPLLADLPPRPLAPAAPLREGFFDKRSRRALLLAGILLAIAVLVTALSIHHLGLLILLVVVAMVVLRRRMRRRRRAAKSFHAHLHLHGTPHWHGPNGPVVGEPPTIQPGGF